MYFGMKNYLKSTRNHTVSYKKKKEKKDRRKRLHDPTHPWKVSPSVFQKC
jgi:hypothetical protein